MFLDCSSRKCRWSEACSISGWKLGIDPSSGSGSGSYLAERFCVGFWAWIVVNVGSFDIVCTFVHLPTGADACFNGAPRNCGKVKINDETKKNKLDQKQGTKVNGKFLFFNSDTIWFRRRGRREDRFSMSLRLSTTFMMYLGTLCLLVKLPPHQGQG